MLVFWRALPAKAKYVHLPIILFCLAIICRVIVYIFEG